MREIKYKIVTGYLNPFGSEVPDIEKKIQGSLDAGFMLVGNLVHIQKNEYSQAMTYEKGDNNER